MGFITSLFGGSGNTILTVILALAIVLVLIVLGVWVLKLIFNVTGNVGRGRNRRLSVVDTMSIDQKRQMVLIRRDNVEHLLLIGGAADLVVETDITPVAQPQPAPAKRSRTQPSARMASSTTEENETEDLDTEKSKPFRSLRHTGLLRRSNRQEPALHPQPLAAEPQFDEENMDDSARSFSQAEESEIIVEPEGHASDFQASDFNDDFTVDNDGDVDSDSSANGKPPENKKSKGH